ncbi:MAG TPA: diguanylate cyclase [Gaiellaceae bacterium]|jgi:GGDEF domain-containing protein|nr:diguanylate cyclase [Gaiellaceae bacterium]
MPSDYRLPAVELDFATGGEQFIDPLTGFGSRAKLVADLADAVTPTSRPSTLAVFELGGLREYVELYGRLEGDDLVARIAGRLPEAIRLPSSFYRPRGDELAALVQGPGAIAEPRVAVAVAALTSRFDEFKLELAFGAVELPDGASDPVEALILADGSLFLQSLARAARERRRTFRG